MSIAGAAIVFALLDKLVQRGTISRGDGLAVLEAAQTRCATLSMGAAAIVRDFHTKMARGD